MPKQNIINQIKDLLKMTISDISEHSGVSTRSVNWVLAGEDVRYSSIVAVLDALELSVLFNKKRSA